MSFIKKNKNYIILITVVSMFLCSSVFRLIPIILFNIEPDTPFKTALISLIGNTITCSIIVYIFRKTLIQDFKVFKSKWLSLLETGVTYWVIGLFIMMISNLIISNLLSGALASNEQNVRNLLTAFPIISIIMTSLLAPLTEELIFRKAFLDVFKNKWSYILISGIIFGSLHVVLTLESMYELLYLIPYCSLGIAFSYMYYETKNIIVPITIHMLHNTILSIFTLISVGMILW